MPPDLLIFVTFAPTKNSSFEVSDDVIACDLWFAPQSKILATPMPITTSSTRRKLYLAEVQ